MHEAKIEKTETGLLPADDGWFILNVADVGWETVPGGGTWSSFESRAARWPLVGIGVHILPPGEMPGFYHAESNQEGFLVLSGECLAIVEGQERRMGPWDYLHCPPGTAHITIGAGDEPCAILMVGTRDPDATIQYLPEPAAARHGAAVPAATDQPKVAYAERPPISPAPSPWPLPPSPATVRKRVVERYLEGFRTGDHELILGCLTDDVEWEMPPHFSLRGRAAFDEAIEHEATPGLPDIRLTRLVEEGDVVVAEGEVRAALAAGGRIDALFCDVFHFREDRIRRLVTYQVDRGPGDQTRRAFEA